jgi:GT2 family glycosyltransferase
MKPQRCSSADVAVLIVNHNGGVLLRDCVQAVLRNRPGQIVVVDNASTDGSADLLQALAEPVTLLRNSVNIGFAAACMQAVSKTNCANLLLLNPDCLLPEQALERMAMAMRDQQQFGLLAPLVQDRHGREQSGSRRRLPTPWRLLAYALGWRQIMDLRQQPVPAGMIALPAVSGACMLIRQSAWQQVNGLDTGFFLHFEDLDLMRRLQDKAWLVGLLPGLSVVHVGGHSSAARPLFVSRCKHQGLLRYLRKHHRYNLLTWTVIPILNWGHYLLQWLQHKLCGLSSAAPR